MVHRAILRHSNRDGRGDLLCHMEVRSSRLATLGLDTNVLTKTVGAARPMAADTENNSPLSWESSLQADCVGPLPTPNTSKR